MQPKQPWYTRWYVWLIPWGMMIALLYLSIQLSPTPVPFRDYTLDEVIQLLTGIAMIALFLERALEVFITTWRGPGSSEKEQDIEKAKDAAEKILAEIEKSVGLSQMEIDAKKVQYNQALLEQQNAEGVQCIYKSQTKRIALWSSLIFGLAVSVVGVRSLEPLTNPEMFKSITDFQRAAFHVVDVLLTGGLIAGGSEGIHKITAIFTEFFEKTRSNIKNS
jgi:hypothetical protein